MLKYNPICCIIILTLVMNLPNNKHKARFKTETKSERIMG